MPNDFPTLRLSEAAVPADGHGSCSGPEPRFRSAALPVLVLLVLVLLPAAFAWNGTFVWDDPGVVQHSRFLHLPPSAFAREVLNRDFGWDVGGAPLNYYRPVVLISLKLNHILAASDSPVSYRIINSLIHFLNAVLLYRILLRALSPASALGRRPAACPPFAAFCSALLFATAGWNSEIVSFISARCESLSLFFFLLAVFFWQRSSASSGLSAKPVASIVVCFLASLLSKETTIPLLAALPVLSLVLPSADRARHFLRTAALAWGTLLLYTAIRGAAGIPLPGGLFRQFLATDWTIEVRVFFHYLLHLAWPVRVFILEPVALPQVTHSVPVLIAAALFGFLWAAAFGAAFRAYPRLVLFTMGAAAAVFFPVLVLHGKDPAYALSERFLYLPAAALAVYGGIFAETIWSRLMGSFRTVALGLFIVVIAFHAAAQARKNFIWANEVRFWNYLDQSAASPAASPLVHGLALLRAGQTREAEIQLNHVAKNHPLTDLRRKADRALELIRKEEKELVPVTE